MNTSEANAVTATTAERVRKFFNKAQRFAMAVSAHDEYIVAARGTGKSEGFDARFILRNVHAMQGSTGAMISPTYAKAWGNTLPAICHALRSWGYIQDVHYYVGRKAPDDRSFALPKRMPLREAWGNCFHFYNGTIMVVLSFNQGMSANSMSLDWVIGPEAKFLDYTKIKSEVNPANRGNRQYFDSCPWHHSVMYTTDMPTTKGGRWILEKEKEMNPRHINAIRTLYKERLALKSRFSEPTDYSTRQLALIEADLALFRRYQPPSDQLSGENREYTTLYAEYDIFDNIEVVGEDFVRQMYRDSPPLVWRTAFLNERLFGVQDGFYSALDDQVHTYLPEDTSHMRGLGANWKKTQGAGCLADGDLDFTQPLHMAFDSNSAISSCCVGQPDEQTNEMKTLNGFFVKTPKKLQELCQGVCDYYSGMLTRRVVVYYDTTFKWTTGTTSESYIDTIEKVLRNNRWEVSLVFIGHPPPHNDKHLQIDQALKGDPQYLFPRFNAIHCEVLLLAMQQTGVKQGKNGFEKDKSAEKRPDSPDEPDEFKTHFTDAWDTLFYGMNFFRSRAGFSQGFGGLIFLQ